MRGCKQPLNFACQHGHRSSGGWLPPLLVSRAITATKRPAVAKAAADVPPTKPKSAVKRPSFQTKLVKTATNPVTWKNGLYAGSLAIAVALPLGLLLLAQK